MSKKKSIYPYLLVAPATLIILLVVFVPVIRAIFMSFQSYDLRKPKDIQFIGLANYVKAFSDPLFLKAFVRTILWVVFGVGFLYACHYFEFSFQGQRCCTCGQHGTLGYTGCSDRSHVEMDF